MSKEDAREMQRMLRLINRTGAIFYAENDDERITPMSFPIERIYILSIDPTLRVRWVGACNDFVQYHGVREWNIRKIDIIEKVKTRYDGEQITVLRGARFGEAQDPDVDTVTLKIADEKHLDAEDYQMMQEWRKERDKRRRHYDNGISDFERKLRNYHPDFDFIMS